ncbi:hypothetical protein Kpol_1031p57 [Vanderwaltozyma polyspora DSM 70294]|uniref:Homoaconitase, mitochondrial n=1 Tax=Vanderwaltozyma polyspora (strain ATCC 22028 / DSM 70294 / BCRC 21397 / CBS 2163 / NBRC 10782 / NRRL Y-8283 / UCD 57-17) TaxID=436907 RepID=A7THY8_VANPO|nr:uncharacterized protein Kpol_1031p57 [Vanderwaltozyma polyspora DSM 70294]EDO18150.1 hypothetical protein Kpol_1031p57 [Vanderwaltozyma polyspora DSM 70294]
MLRFKRFFSEGSIRLTRGQNLTEKIVQRYAVELPEGKKVFSGDYVSIRPSYCMSHDNSWPIALKFMGLGATKLKYPDQIVNTLDHDVQNKSEKNLTKYRNIENFAKKHGSHFYPAGRGIGHQIMIEEGYAFPLNLTVASDSHSNIYGGVGCLGTPIVRTDAASIWATGQTWWQIPPVAQVELKGELPTGVSGKDIIVALCGLFNDDQVLNHAIEFTGDSIKNLSIDNRLTIANMTTEWGALSGLFPVDSTVIQWYKERINKVGEGHIINSKAIEELEQNAQKLKADSNSKYDKKLTIDLSTLTYYVSGPNSVKISNPVEDLSKQDIKINKAYLVSCTNSRLSDIEAAADVVCPTGNIEDVKKVAPGVNFYIAAASSEVEKEARTSGAWDKLLKAGCIALPAGCGPCIGLGTGLLEAGEVGISATNRNFKGRMGSKDALAYLASPAVVAASALAGKIVSPNEALGIESCKYASVKTSEQILEEETSGTSSGPTEASRVEILEGFPSEISGELVFCDADNINTDGIYPGKYTYQDDISKEMMAEVCMENYDPEFQTKTKTGDIIISGFNFGTGSSREQAATCILARGINLVVSGSFGNIFSRNSINNGLLTVEVPKLIEQLRSKYKDDTPELTRRTGWFFKWDVANKNVTVREGSLTGTIVFEQEIPELGKNLQEIIVKGGLEGWVKSKLN